MAPDVRKGTCLSRARFPLHLLALGLAQRMPLRAGHLFPPPPIAVFLQILCLEDQETPSPSQARSSVAVCRQDPCAATADLTKSPGHRRLVWTCWAGPLQPREHEGYKNNACRHAQCLLSSTRPTPCPSEASSASTTRIVVSSRAIRDECPSGREHIPRGADGAPGDAQGERRKNKLVEARVPRHCRRL